MKKVIFSASTYTGKFHNSIQTFNNYERNWFQTIVYKLFIRTRASPPALIAETELVMAKQAILITNKKWRWGLAMFCIFYVHINEKNTKKIEPREFEIF